MSGLIRDDEHVGTKVVADFNADLKGNFREKMPRNTQRGVGEVGGKAIRCAASAGKHPPILWSESEVVFTSVWHDSLLFSTHAYRLPRQSGVFICSLAFCRPT